MYESRRALSDADKLGRIYALYNAFCEKAVYRDRILFDSGYPDAITINWLVKCVLCLANSVFLAICFPHWQNFSADTLEYHRLGLTDAHFGFPLQSGHIEWESLVNFIQVWKANPVKQADGTWRSDPEGLQIVLRLKTRYVDKFRAQLQVDHVALGSDLHTNERASL